ncbi:hypothetical protein BEP19_02445 [Ammoniphilus oxalaticus]|uniref:Methionyl-tRNA formyltransferase n=2 Tax=Ammoniphilus oxalaticus TaxID=66863 RepID=A0A419SP25_9BACL|nr:hypothetical protein BEP19_02445 [Ammoniphilus oxalaticus]
MTKNVRVHGTVDATYTVFVKGGEKYIQINTYGSKERQVKGVASQSIQFNKSSVRQLLEIIGNEF